MCAAFDVLLFPTGSVSFFLFHRGGFWPTAPIPFTHTRRKLRLSSHGCVIERRPAVLPCLLCCLFFLVSLFTLLTALLRGHSLLLTALPCIFTPSLPAHRFGMHSHSLSTHCCAATNSLPVTHTQEVLGRFGCEGVTSAAEQLREIANLYVVPPENLLSLMEQGRLADMGKEVRAVPSSPSLFEAILLMLPSLLYSVSLV